VLLYGFSKADDLNLIQSFIVNGTVARIDDFPFTAEIVFLKSLNRIAELKSQNVPLSGFTSSSCGATSPNDDWILTVECSGFHC
jgi:hypothetical protein